jgi:MarR family 2-MHQ and catechol resistance regulon transcriptional repressor
MSLDVGDPLAHRALEALLRAETGVRRALGGELEREGVSAAGFSALVVLTTAGGRIELRALRNRLRWSKANATEVTSTLAAAGLVARRRDLSDRRAVALELLPAGRDLVERVFPEHTRRVSMAFAGLDDAEKRSLAELCRKLAA